MNSLSRNEDKTPQQRQAAAVHIAMSQRHSGRMMEYPNIITDIRRLRLEDLTWKEVTREMKEPLIETELARKVDYSRNKYFRTLTNTVAKAHNDRRDFDPEIRAIKDGIRSDEYLEGLVMDAIEDRGSFSAPLRIAEVRTALMSIGLRPREIDTTDARYRQGTIDLRKYEIRNFNRLARVVFGELFFEEDNKDVDETLWTPRDGR